MAKKKNDQKATGMNPAGQPGPAPRPQQAKAAAKEDAGVSIWTTAKGQAIIAGCIALITWLFLQVCTGNQFTNWDDPGYIKDNALIKDISAEGLKNIFSTPVMGNYHPLTILTYAIEYSFVKLEPALYHTTSLLFHIGVTLLVYWFARLLTRSTIAAAVTALLFGLHPMHMESVAWLAGRKDVVYGLFYMAACVAYVYYVRAAKDKRGKWYALVLLFFVCSLLAKPVAVVLPVTLLLIDLWERRQWNKVLILEKLPHFAIAIAFGIRSMMDQKAFGSLATQDVSYNILERISLGGYALVTYLWKAVVPAGLSCFYPYPEKVGSTIPFLYVLYPVGVIVALALVWVFARRNRIVLFGVLFFLVNIALLLQFIPVGGAIIADRYSYIPYLGLFIMAGWLVSRYFELGDKTRANYLVPVAAGAYLLLLGYLSNERCMAWYDTTSLWRDEIEKQPNAPNAYNNLGFNYFNRFNESVDPAEKKIAYDSAYYLLHKAIELQHTFANPYVSLGELYRASGQFDEARKYYYQGLALKDKEGSANAYLGLGIIYAMSKNFDSAYICFRNAVTHKEYFPEAHSNFGNYFDMIGQHDSSLKEYGVALSQNPDMYAPYLNRGRELQRMHRCDEAMKDFERALALQPNMGEIYYSRSYCYTQQGNKAMALQEVEKAISLGFRNIDNAYYQMLKSR